MSSIPKLVKSEDQNVQDCHLRDSVILQLEWEPEIDEKEIGVAVDDGVAILSGYVNSYPEKIAAEKAAKSVYGTHAVANDIQVKPAYKRVDPDIAKDALHALKVNVKVPDEQISFTIKNGIITLEGKVDWNYQRRAAESAVKNLLGVTGVVNAIEVSPNGTTEQLKEKIEEALHRTAEVDSRRIRVRVDEGVVSLTGNVHSRTERKEAERVAWAAPGVSNVENHINVFP
jgi:osmotically-inducible protein OsmY